MSPTKINSGKTNKCSDELKSFKIQRFGEQKESPLFSLSLSLSLIVLFLWLHAFEQLLQVESLSEISNTYNGSPKGK